MSTVKKWTVHGVVSGGKFLGTVEAATEEEAIEKTWNLDSASVSVCHACAREIEDPEITEIVASEVARG